MRYCELFEAPLPLGKPVDVSGLTFGFEAEFLVTQAWYFTQAWSAHGDSREVGTYAERGLSGLQEVFSWTPEHQKQLLLLWQDEGHDGDADDMLSELGAAEFLKRVHAVPRDGVGYDASTGEVFEGRKSQHEVFRNVSDSLSNNLGIQCQVAEYQDKVETKSQAQWYIEGDRSVVPDGSFDYACEITSPVFDDASHVLMALEAILNWIRGAAAAPVGYTNGTCGLHINIGVPKGATLDVVKLLIFAGEDYLAKQFARDNPFQTRSLVASHKAFTGSEEDFEKGLDPLVARLNQDLKSGLADKHSLINPLPYFRGLGYIEFRAPGGKAYETRFAEIKQHFARFVALMRLACNPAAARKDYARKLYHVLVDEKHDADMVTRYIENWLRQVKPPPYIEPIMANGRFTVMPHQIVFLLARVIKDGGPMLPQPILKRLLTDSGITADSVTQFLTRISNDAASIKAGQRIFQALGAPFPDMLADLAETAKPTKKLKKPLVIRLVPADTSAKKERP